MGYGGNPSLREADTAVGVGGPLLVASHRGNPKQRVSLTVSQTIALLARRSQYFNAGEAIMDHPQIKCQIREGCTPF